MQNPLSKIRTKEGKVAPCGSQSSAANTTVCSIKKQLAAEGKVRVIILKARQQGLSTHVGGYLYFSVSQNTARKAMVITHHADSTRALFDMTRGIMKTVPRYLGRTPNTHQTRAVFRHYDSSYVVATAVATALGVVKPNARTRI